MLLLPKKQVKLLVGGGVQEKKTAFNVVNNLKLLPKFTDDNPDLFFLCLS